MSQKGAEEKPRIVAEIHGGRASWEVFVGRRDGHSRLYYAVASRMDKPESWAKLPTLQQLVSTILRNGPLRILVAKDPNAEKPRDWEMLIV